MNFKNMDNKYNAIAELFKIRDYIVMRYNDKDLIEAMVKVIKMVNDIEVSYDDV